MFLTLLCLTILLSACKLCIPKAARERKDIIYRKIKSIDISKFCNDINNPVLANPELLTDELEDLVHLVNTELTNILDKHAPIKRSTITIRPNTQWYNETIKEQKCKRRKLERRWRASGLTIDRELFVQQSKVVNKLICGAKMSYYSTIIQENNGDSRILFYTIDTLLHRKAEKKLPHTNDNESLPYAFSDFFATKIALICDELQMKRQYTENTTEHGDNYCVTKLSTFEPINCDDLSELICTSTLKSCALDPLPASVLKVCLHQLLPVLTKLVNVSLQRGVVSAEMKQAIISPILKETLLDQEEYSNYRPISNFMFLSKSCEKVVASQLTRHLQNNNIQELYQSAYKTGHSTQTALLRVQNDVLRAIDNGRCVVLLLLDLSAAFDTVKHTILHERLATHTGVDGSAHKWFVSYLSDRQQTVYIERSSSSSRHLSCGIPQGSVLEPLLYLIYSLPLGSILRRHDVSYHMYADDTQVYLSFKSSVLNDMERSRTKVEECLRDINSWMLQKNLKLI